MEFLYHQLRKSASVAFPVQGGPRADRYKFGVKWGPYKWPKINGSLGLFDLTYRGPITPLKAFLLGPPCRNASNIFTWLILVCSLPCQKDLVHFHCRRQSWCKKHLICNHRFGNIIGTTLINHTWNPSMTLVLNGKGLLLDGSNPKK